VRKLTVLLATCLAVATALTQTPKPVRIAAHAYGFSFEVTDGWNVALGSDGLPLFANFPWSSLQAQGILPKNGATIHIIAFQGLPRRRGDETLDGWARLDAVNAMASTLTIEALTVPPVARIPEAVFSSFSETAYSSDEQHQHDASVYWRFGRERFAAHLFYVEGDPRGKLYEAVLKNVVRSLRPQ